MLRRSVSNNSSKSAACRLSTGVSPKRGLRVWSIAERTKCRFDGDQSGARRSQKASSRSATIMECAARLRPPYWPAVNASQRPASASVRCVADSCLRFPVAKSWTVRRACQLFPRSHAAPLMSAAKDGSCHKSCDNGNLDTVVAAHLSQQSQAECRGR
jgi:hypothetical protein